MKLTLLGSVYENGQSPTIFATDAGTYVVQGWKIMDSEALAQMKIPDHETAVEIPAELLRFVPPSA